jgi:hypothetical protein
MLQVQLLILVFSRLLQSYHSTKLSKIEARHFIYNSILFYKLFYIYRRLSAQTYNCVKKRIKRSLGSMYH